MREEEEEEEEGVESAKFERFGCYCRVIEESRQAGVL